MRASSAEIPEGLGIHPVERDGVRLIAVVMKAKGTHYTDTRAMLDYGFALHDAGKI